MTEVLVLQAAILGPALAGAVWLATSRWPLIRRVSGGVVALAAHGAGWTVLWTAYRGDPARWRAFTPDLLGASVAVAAELAVLIVALRADALGRWSPPAMCALAAATAAVVGSAFARSLAVQAVLLPIPTLAAAVAAVSGRSRPDMRGLLGLAAADGVALVGLSIAFSRLGTSLISAEGGVLGGGLILAASAIKAGAVPGIGTWRLAATDGPGAPVSSILRGQGVALAVLGGLILVPAEPHAVTAGLAAAAVLAGGAAVVWARTTGIALTALSGAAAAVVFVALGLGGAVGTRAALVLFPPFLLAAGSAFALGWTAPPPDDERQPPEPRARWRWLGAGALAVAVVTLAGLPFGGAFPGTWLAVSLAGVRTGSAASYYALAGAVLLGLALAGIGAAPLVRRVRGRAAPALAGAVVAATLLYMGVLPVRLGIGWWLRIERDLGTRNVLPASGAPTLPPIGGRNLLLLLGGAVLAVGAVVALAGGFRDRLVPADVGVPPTARGPVRRAVARLGPPTERLRRAGVGVAAAAVLEAAALILAVRLVFLAARSGFL
jgi:hypothetical protein